MIFQGYCNVKTSTGNNGTCLNIYSCKTKSRHIAGLDSICTAHKWFTRIRCASEIYMLMKIAPYIIFKSYRMAFCMKMHCCSTKFVSDNVLYKQYYQFIICYKINHVSKPIMQLFLLVHVYTCTYNERQFSLIIQESLAASSSWLFVIQAASFIV